MNIHQKIELRLLARTDALFLPLSPNTAGTDQWSAVWQYRRRFFDVGLGMVTEAGDRSAERAELRALHELAEMGRVRLTRPKGGRTALVKLSDEADDEARMLAWHGGTVSDALWLIGACLNVENESSDSWEPHYCHHAGDRVWIPEEALPGCGHDSEDRKQTLFFRRQQSLAGVVRGWILGNTTVRGHARYCVTPKGREVYEAATDADLIIGKLTDQDAADFYLDQFNTEWKRLRALIPPAEGEIGEIALPVSPNPPKWYRQEKSEQR